MTQHELDNDLPAYLVFLILGNIKKLKQLSPDHILVKAVEGILEEDKPQQAEMDLRTPLMRHQAD